MTDRSHARLVMVQEARSTQRGVVLGSRRPAVRRYRLARISPLAEPVASRLAQMRALQD